MTMRTQAVADDGDHIAIVGDVGFVAQPAVPGNDDGAALLVLAGHGDIENRGSIRR